jgi:hypothetical protein
MTITVSRMATHGKKPKDSLFVSLLVADILIFSSNVKTSAQFGDQNPN